VDRIRGRARGRGTDTEFDSGTGEHFLECRKRAARVIRRSDHQQLADSSLSSVRKGGERFPVRAGSQDGDHVYAVRGHPHESEAGRPMTAIVAIELGNYRRQCQDHTGIGVVACQARDFRQPFPLMTGKRKDGVRSLDGALGDKKGATRSARERYGDNGAADFQNGSPPRHSDDDSVRRLEYAFKSES